MRWESEKWRKLYRRVDATWLKLPVLARGLGSELLKYADDDGRVALQEDEETGEGLCRIMSAHKAERKLVADLAQKLLSDGYIVREPGAVLIRNFVRAQARSSNAERQARYRQRHTEPQQDEAWDTDDSATEASRAAAGSDVTSNGPSNASVTPPLPNEVTDRALPLSLSGGISGSISAELQKKVPEIARARDSEPRAKPGEQAGLWGGSEPARKAKRRGAETPIPDGWAPSQAHFALGRDLGKSEEQVRHEAAMFRSDALAKDKRFVRWGQAFETWLRRFPSGSTGHRPRGSVPQPGPMQVHDREIVPPEEQEKSLV